VPEDEPGVGAEADQQAIDDEFWKRK